MANKKATFEKKCWYSIKIRVVGNPGNEFDAKDGLTKVLPGVITFFILIFNSFFICSAQDEGLGSWNIVNVKYNQGAKWSVFGEGQLRSLKFYSDFHYYEVKGGINFKIYPRTIFTLGAGTYQTYKEGGNFVLPKNNDEFRLWPQVLLLQSIGRLNIEQRYRAEFRFTSDGYKNRYRYRLGLSYPFGILKNGYKPFQIIASDELFFTEKEPYFERNRLQFAFSYKASMTTTLQLGYIHQFDYQINDETGRQFLQIGIYVELFSRKLKDTVSDSSLKEN